MFRAWPSERTLNEGVDTRAVCKFVCATLMMAAAERLAFTYCSHWGHKPSCVARGPTRWKVHQPVALRFRGDISHATFGSMPLLASEYAVLDHVMSYLSMPEPWFRSQTAEWSKLKEEDAAISVVSVCGNCA